jgi:hypothetical protein
MTDFVIFRSQQFIGIRIFKNEESHGQSNIQILYQAFSSDIRCKVIERDWVKTFQKARHGLIVIRLLISPKALLD